MSRRSFFLLGSVVLKARGAKLQSIQPLIPSVRELQAMGITFDLLIPYLMTVNEKAVTKNI